MTDSELATEVLLQDLNLIKDWADKCQMKFNVD